MMTKITKRKRGSDHPHAKLTEDQVREIRSLHGKYSLSIMADRFGVSEVALSQIILRKTWKHIK